LFRKKPQNLQKKLKILLPLSGFNECIGREPPNQKNKGEKKQ